MAQNIWMELISATCLAHNLSILGGLMYPISNFHFQFHLMSVVESPKPGQIDKIVLEKCREVDSDSGILLQEAVKTIQFRYTQHDIILFSF